ncbi:MAG: S-adenosylmethionine:tRNA ribosyltransferase-isomerase, partial [Planctomycetota bacterium]|nr:S-adenosylmethionine:tRNA ribosyltransferase-isomerase [Planctomycetota bacterium]
MEISELDFELPEQLIARYPAAKRRQSRLLVANADSSSWHHHQFSDLPQWFKKGDLLVLNDTKVVPALLKLHKKTGGKIEALFLRAEGQLARCMISGSRLRPGVELFTESGDGKVELTEKLPRGEWLIKLVDGDWQQFLQQHGRPPLPPYIRRMRQVDGGQSDSDLD